MSSYIGEIAAFGTVICWVICSMAFERAGKRIGSMPVNLIRLFFAFILVTVTTFFSRGLLFPSDASPTSWFWLSLSGIVGFFIGDLCLFRAFVLIGSRISLLIYSLAPPVTAIFGYIIFKEKMSAFAILGMFITIIGISVVILKKDDNKITLSHPIWGVVLAILGALGQAFGIVLSKIGMTLPDGSTYDPWASTQIRIISSLICFVLLFTFTKRWKYLLRAFKNKVAITELAVGAFFGPFIGVTLGLIAITYTIMGVASTITAILPVVIIIPHVILYKEKIYIREIVGSIIAVFGVTLLFI